MGEAIGSTLLSALLRGGNKKPKTRKESLQPILEVVWMREAKKSGVKEGHIMDVTLITEGLGNRRNLNYYGPEAIASAPGAFEGKPCFNNHPSESEDRDIPERRVQDKVGYFKGCRVESLNGVNACVGELHFDLSEAGEQAYLKCCTALHYQQEFPGIDTEYVGLSINASGEHEKRKVTWEGETLEVNYVTRFVGAMSCDLVTSPARGGKILALVESAAGKTENQKEDRLMSKLHKLLEAARAAQKEADAEKGDLELKNTKVSEATKAWDAFMAEVKAVEAAQIALEAKKKEKKAEDAEKDAEEESKEDSESGGDEEADDDGDDDDAPAAKKPKKQEKKKEKKSKEEEDESKESKRLAVEAIASKAGLELDEFRLGKLSEIPLTEARQEIESLKKMQESIVKKMAKAFEVPVTTFSKLSESSTSKEAVGDNLFASCVR